MICKLVFHFVVPNFYLVLQFLFEYIYYFICYILYDQSNFFPWLKSQAQKLKREREQHELALKRQQVEREKLLAEQRRQLELLRKQQQTMTDKNKVEGKVNIC